VLETLNDMKEAGVAVATIGQYMQPTRKHLPVLEYVTPEMFDYLPLRRPENGLQAC
jgi:lipoyl synthase